MQAPIDVDIGDVVSSHLHYAHSMDNPFLHHHPKPNQLAIGMTSLSLQFCRDGRAPWTLDLPAWEDGGTLCLHCGKIVSMFWVGVVGDLPPLQVQSDVECNKEEVSGGCEKRQVRYLHRVILNCQLPKLAFMEDDLKELSE